MRTLLASAIALAILAGCRLPATPATDAGDAGTCTNVIVVGIDAGAVPSTPGY